MARYYKYLAISCWLLAVGMLASCQEGREAGDFFGQWRLTGSDTQYISFSGSIVWIKNLNQAEVYGNFQHRGDSLYIQCFSKHGIPADTILVEQTFGFRPFTDIRLKIDRLDDDNLILSAGSQHWSFYKY